MGEMADAFTYFICDGRSSAERRVTHRATVRDVVPPTRVNDLHHAYELATTLISTEEFPRELWFSNEYNVEKQIRPWPKDFTVWRIDVVELDAWVELSPDVLFSRVGWASVNPTAAPRLFEP